MTALPSKGDLNGSGGGHNQGIFKAAIGGLRDFLAALLGTDGTQAAALAALRVLDPQAVYNLKPVFSVDSNALTCTIKDRAGADLSATNPAFIGQRSATASDGGFNLRAMTANVALTISSGSTLGHASGVADNLYWYLLDNAGVQVLAVSGSFKGFSGLYSTTAEGGAGAADSGSVLYAEAAHSDLPGRLVAVTTDTQTTAGTWAAIPSATEIIPQITDVRGQVLTRNSNEVMTRNNHRDVLVVTGSFTQTFSPAAALGKGWWLDFIVNGGATLTLDPDGTETVDGSATKVIVGPAQGRLVCNGTLLRTQGVRGAGEILQVVTATDAGGSTTSASLANLNVSNVSITPKSANSDLLVEVSFTGYIPYVTSVNTVAQFQLRDVTNSLNIGYLHTLQSPSGPGGNSVQAPCCIRVVVSNAGLTARSFQLRGLTTNAGAAASGVNMQWSITEIQK